MHTPSHYDENEVLTWLKTYSMDGYNALKEEPVWTQVSKNMDYVEGRQSINRKEGRSTLVNNRIKRALFTTVAEMTDIRPISEYYTENPIFKNQAEILNKLNKAWWRDTSADRGVQEALKFAGVGGSGYVYLGWNPSLPGGGNLELIPMDPRDVIPLGHPVYSQSLQEWRGVCIRQRRSVGWIKDKYPHKAHEVNTAGSWFMDDVRKRPLGEAVYAKVWDVLKSGMVSSASGDGVTDLMRIFLKDTTVWTGDTPVRMGRGNWAYTVYPLGSTHPVTQKEVTEDEARLYPRGRLVVCTPNCILDDTPNPYWHGMFPVIRLTLDPLPWSLLGVPLVGELVGLQDDLNSALRGMSDSVKQWIKRPIIADKTAIDPTMLEKMDTSDPGWKIRINPTGGNPFTVGDGPRLPEYYMKYIEYLQGAIDDTAGVKDIEQLAALKQMPAADTVETFMQAMTPVLRLRARGMEVSLAEIAEMMKVNFFQFYDIKRRIKLLGQDGIASQDFLDFDPDQMVPSLAQGDPGYVPELDKDLDRVKRAQYHHRNFTFHVTMNSLLNVSHVQQKMLMLQLYRTGALDIWSLWEALDVPGIGAIPPKTVIERMQLQGEMGIPNPALAQAAPPTGAPPGGGRPPSGQQPPQMETRNTPEGGQRMLMSESG